MVKKSPNPVDNIDKTKTQNIRIWVATLLNVRVLLADPKMKGESQIHFYDRVVRREAAEKKIDLPF